MGRILRIAVIGAFVFVGYYASAQTHVVISEVYGGGGNANAQYKNDFIELYNPTASDIVMTSWSIQYTSAAGSTWSSNLATFSGTIKSKGYFLIRMAAGANTALPDLPTPDATPGTVINMSATAGKVALCNSTTALTGTNPNSPLAPNLVDFVGFGGTSTSTNGFEGAGPTTAPSNSASVERKANASSTAVSMITGGVDEYLGNGYDVDNNPTDFVARAPQPQNSLSGVEPDVTPPTFTSAYPKAANLTESSFDLVVSLNEAGKAYYVVLPDGATAPSVAQVKAGQDDLGAPVANSGFISVIAPTTDAIKNITGLSPSTSYDVYIAAVDAPLNTQLSTVKLEVTTTVSTAPTISPSSPSLTFPGFTDKAKQSAQQSYTITAANLTNDVALSVSGNFLLSSDNLTYASAISIDKTLFGSPQTVYVKFNPSGNAGTQTGNITNSTIGGTDKLVSLSAIAIDPLSQNFNDPAILSNSGWTQYSKIGAQVWATTNFGHTCLVGCTAGTLDKAVQINGFATTAQDNQDWLISPQMDLTGFVNFPALSFWTISAFAGNSLQLKYSSDYSGSGDPTLATWTDIDGKFPAANSSLWTQSSNIILPKSSIYVAIVYVSTTAGASRWTFDDWKVEDLSGYVNVPSIAFSFGEISAGNSSSSQNFTFTGSGLGDITVSAPSGYEVSVDNTVFTTTTLVTAADALSGKTIYVRFSPPNKQLKWDGTLTFSGTSYSASFGSLTGTSYPKSETFDITAYNLEFFGSNVADGSGEYGPVDDALQVSNVTSVMQTIGSDIFSVEEVSDDASMDQLVANLSGYDKVMSDKWSYSFNPPDPTFPPQKIGIVYKTSTVQIVSSRVMFSEFYDDIRAAEAVSLSSALALLPGYPSSGGNTPSNFWSSGRLPFMVTADVTVNSFTKRVKFIVLHSKSGSAQADYDRRKYDVQLLHDSLVTNYPNDNIIILGDFNDDVDASINTGSPSSYKMFVDDATNFTTLTYALSQAGGFSFPSSSSFLDHIIISNELTSDYVSNSILVEDPRTYISGYTTTTSDHLPVSARFVLAKANQTITFNALPAKTYGDPSFTLAATTTSGLAISYSSSDPTIASISGNTVTILKPGTVDIMASQSGNADFLAATDVTRQLVISKASQAITFGAPSAMVFGDSPFDLTATSTSGLAVAFASSDPAIASIVGNTVTMNKAGTVTITATQSGNDNYLAASDVPQSLVINKVTQTITFSTLSARTFGDQAFDLTATSTSGLVVSFTSSDPSIASIVGKTVTINKAGTVTIAATQIGNDNYLAASNVPQSLVINKATQTITFGALPAKTFGNPSFDLSATSTSGLVVSFTSSDPAVASVVGKTVTINKAGTVTIAATQSGNDNYLAASNVPQSLVINKATQTITFGTLPVKTFGDQAFDLTATSASGLVVSFTSSDPSIASIVGKTVTINKSGTVTITAAQSGNDNYLTASNVPQSLVISKATQTITFGALAAKTFGDQPFDLSATSTSGLVVSFTSSDPAIASIAGKTVTLKKGGTVTITASQGGNDNYSASSDVTQSLVINKAAQTITFTSIPTKTVGDAAFSLSATSTSSLAVSFGTTSDKVTLSGSQVTIVKAGSVTITASQTGSDSYNAATTVNQTFCINPAKPTITLSNVNTESPTLTSSSSTGNQWYLNGTIITGATNATYSANTAGIYKVQVKADNCTSAFSNDTPLIVTGDIQQINKQKIAAYPNPVEDYLMISGLSGEITECIITDMAGRTATLKLERQNGTHRADVRNYGTGLYLARVQDGNEVHQIKFIKK